MYLSAGGMVCPVGLSTAAACAALRAGIATFGELPYSGQRRGSGHRRRRAGPGRAVRTAARRAAGSGAARLPVRDARGGDAEHPDAGRPGRARTPRGRWGSGRGHCWPGSGTVANDVRSWPLRRDRQGAHGRARRPAGGPGDPPDARRSGLPCLRRRLLHQRQRALLARRALAPEARGSHQRRDPGRGCGRGLCATAGAFGRGTGHRGDRPGLRPRDRLGAERRRRCRAAAWPPPAGRP